MSIAGLNCRINIYRINFDPDDVVGGAVTTGTLQYQDVRARIQANPEEQLLLQQGLETIRTFTATLIPGTLDIRERDEIEVSQPIDHNYYGDRFRITGVRFSDFNKRNPRNYMMLTLQRSVRAKSRQ